LPAQHQFPLPFLSSLSLSLSSNNSNSSEQKAALPPHNIAMFISRSTLSLASRSRSFSSKVVQNQKIVILGSGWGGYSLASKLTKSLCSNPADNNTVTVVSPANHFVFTPLLPSTATGTLEFRTIQEPLRNIENLNYHQAKARGVDFDNNKVLCGGLERVARDYKPKVGSDPSVFAVPYTSLIIAAGVKTNTFQTPNVSEREGREVFFLKRE
jgi:NADH:ubiquinone reductase (non-electrogenic)